MEEKTFTVKNLISELEKIEDKENTVVALEGCDCDGLWNGNLEKAEEDSQKTVLLNRD